LQESVLHAKTAVIDGYWSTVGSTNLDMRSFLHNREVNLITLDAQFGSIMESAFNEDLKNSIEITPEKWEQRPFSDRIREWTARRFEYWL
jgi:cardiolipin synthase A/B